MKYRTRNTIDSLRSRIQAAAEQADLRGDEDVAAELLGIVDQLRDILDQCSTYKRRGEVIHVNFQHDGQEDVS